MKKDSEEKNILKHQKRRRNKKIRLGVSSVVFIIIAIILILIYLELGKNEYNTYSEEAKVDYKVELKDNDYYPEDYEFANKFGIEIIPVLRKSVIKIEFSLTSYSVRPFVITPKPCVPTYL